VRRVAFSLAGALAVLLAWPGTGPAGQILDLVGGAGAGVAVIGQEPAPSGSPPPWAAAPLPSAAAPRPSAAAPLPKHTPATPLPESMAPAAPALLAISDSDVPKLRYGESWGLRAPAVESLEGYAWPLAHPRLTLPFGPTVWGSRWVNGERFHDGADLATFCGDRIMAAHAGTVLAAGRHYDAYMGWIGDIGPYLNRLDQKNLWTTLPIVVVIDDGNGYRSVYAHFGRVTVKPGQEVKAGQLIGYEGMTGRASGCHLHFGLFSPWEQDAMAIRADVAKRMKLPKEEIARIDPLQVLPPKAGINAPATPKPSTPAPTTAP
jgi:murein DD-endopeptidase MepM/ murein hydrolase activator NlpD